ncbi:MAG TPA: SH3 domain-containing protein [Devosiaceae bacterium]
MSKAIVLTLTGLLALLSLTSNAPAQTRASANLAAVTTTVNVRQGPGTNFPVVDVLHSGEQVEMVRCNRTFCLVTHEGQQGWVNSQFLQRLFVRPN